MHLILLITLTVSLHVPILLAACSNGNHGGPGHTHSVTTTQQDGTQQVVPRLGRDTNAPGWLDERMGLASSIRSENQTNLNMTTTTTTTTTTNMTSPEMGTNNRSNSRTGIGGHTHDLGGFRLEYNKYKILSHLGITENLDVMSPTIDEDTRQKLFTTPEFKELSQTSSVSSRHKRSLTCDQVKSDKSACCLESFYVNFTHIGWDKWILYPQGYNANYCRGQCDLSHTRYYHSTLLSKYSNVISLCCSPKQMAPLRLLYIDEENKVHQKSIPDMVVESCDCA